MKLPALCLATAFSGGVALGPLELLAAVHPQWAVISSGAENPYGHPSLELLERLHEVGARTLRTDQNGAVHILTDGDNLEISCFLDCSPSVLAKDSASAQSPDHKQEKQ